MKDPYVYEGTNVLINILEIKDEKSLDSAESAFAGLAANKLKNSNFRVDSIFDCLTIHKMLFCKIYEWAGQARTIDIYKGEALLDGRSIDYVYASYIKQALLDLDKEYKSTDWDKLDSKEKIEKICYFVSEFWHIHPFREGNTRTSAMMLYFLLKKSKMHVNMGFLSKNGKYFRNALVLNCLYSNSKPEYLFGIVADSTSIKDISDDKYKTINGYEVDKYTYQSHTMEKIKTINNFEDWHK